MNQKVSLQMNEGPKVSVGMPVYNGEKKLAKALESIINQTYTNIEIIISDNCSTDLTSEICQKYLGLDGGRNKKIMAK